MARDGGYFSVSRPPSFVPPFDRLICFTNGILTFAGQYSISFAFGRITICPKRRIKLLACGKRRYYYFYIYNVIFIHES